MAQKIIICEGEIGTDLLQSQPLAGCIADGFEVTQVSGYSARDNRQMCVVLLSEPTVQTVESNTEPQGETTPQSETEPSENEPSETEPSETEPSETEPQNEP